MRRGPFAVTYVIMLSMAMAISSVDAIAGDGVVRLYAAGSLRPAFTALIADFQKAQGIQVEPTFGASGLLRERLASGEQGGCRAGALHPVERRPAGFAKARF
jgi:ABC-type molybdate transport system substrate-binding protein